MIEEKLKRINELTALSRQRELSAAETAERNALRKEYIAEWRQGTLNVLENLYVLDENGMERKLPKKKQ